MRLLNLLRRTPTVADLPEPILPAVNAQMVSPREQRSPEAVAGPFYVVSDQCIICDLPPETAPSSIRFHFTANCGDCPHYCYVYKQPETREELDRIIEAARRSCVEAIRYCGTDPYVLQRLSVAGYARLCDAYEQSVQKPNSVGRANVRSCHACCSTAYAPVAVAPLTAIAHLLPFGDFAGLPWNTL
jgi:hypothetical protein